MGTAGQFSNKRKAEEPVAVGGSEGGKKIIQFCYSRKADWACCEPAFGGNEVWNRSEAKICTEKSREKEEVVSTLDNRQPRKTGACKGGVGKNRAKKVQRRK